MAVSTQLESATSKSNALDVINKALEQNNLSSISSSEKGEIATLLTKSKNYLEKSSFYNWQPYRNNLVAKFKAQETTIKNDDLDPITAEIDSLLSSSFGPGHYKNTLGFYADSHKTATGLSEKLIGYTVGGHDLRLRIQGFGAGTADKEQLVDATYSFGTPTLFGFMRSQFKWAHQAFQAQGFALESKTMFSLHALGFAGGPQPFQPFVAVAHLSVSPEVASDTVHVAFKTGHVMGLQAGVQSVYNLTPHLTLKSFALWQKNINPTGFFAKRLHSHLFKLESGLHYKHNNIRAGISYNVHYISTLQSKAMLAIEAKF